MINKAMKKYNTYQYSGDTVYYDVQSPAGSAQYRSTVYTS